jgi:hypothetical protein
MRMRACIGFLVAGWLTVTAASSAADATTPAPIALVQLKDGRQLHNVKVMSNEPASIVVRADEGLIKISKSNLPQSVADLYPARVAPTPTPELVMQPFNPSPGLMAPGSEPSVRPLQIPTPDPNPPSAAVYKGCTIVSFQLKAFQASQGCVEVVVKNDTDTPVDILPGNFGCVTTDGKHLRGGYIVTEGYPVVIKHSETVPARGQIVDIVAFSNHELDVSTIQWVR